MTKNTLVYSSLLRELRGASYAYYIKSDPIMTDEEYDRKFRLLQSMEDEDPTLITSVSPTQCVGYGGKLRT